MVASQNFLHWARWAGRAAVALLLVAGVGMLLLWLAGKFAPKVPMESGAPAAHQQPPAGRVVSVRSVSVPLSETAVGTIRAVHETSIGSKLLARVVEVNLKAGQKVQPRRRARAAGRHRSAGQAPAGQGGRGVCRGRPRPGRSRCERAMPSCSSPEPSASRNTSEPTTALQSAEAELRRRAGGRQRSAGHARLGHHPLADGRHRHRQEGRRGRHGYARPDAGHALRSQARCNWWPASASRWPTGCRSARASACRSKASTSSAAARSARSCPKPQSASRAFQVKVTGPCPPGIYTRHVRAAS